MSNKHGKVRKLRKSTLPLHLMLMRRRMAGNEDGATAIEYALIASGIGATIAATVWSFGTSLKSNFYDVIAAML